MKLAAPAFDLGRGRLLVEPVNEDAFARAVLNRLALQGPELRDLTEATRLGDTLRGTVKRRISRDLGDPLRVGWTYLVAEDDPDREDIARVLRPLADRRGMREVEQPLIFAGEPLHSWFEWMLDRYWTLEGEPPHYVLIVGGPERIPFHFQAHLDTVAAVGRIAFDNLGELEAYVEKVLRLEDADPAPARRGAVVFATDHGAPDPTFYSRRHMAEPLARHARDTLGVATELIVGEHATPETLLEAVAEHRPAVLYTATHGASCVGKPLEEQKRLSGALVCSADGNLVFSADDVPSDLPFLEGGVMYQFACFGYGTLAESDYAHWLGDESANAPVDFVSALPRRLVSHPRGPVAYVGHVDLTWLHAFEDPDDVDSDAEWGPRMEPFISAVERLLGPEPAGEAMEEMNKRYAAGNATLASIFDQQQRGPLPERPTFYRTLVKAFIMRSDAQNHLLFGDPAVYVRMEDR